MDTAQVVLIFVIVVLTVLLLVLGIQVFFILRDVRKTLSKANKVLDDASHITRNVSGPIEALSSFSSTMKAGSVITIIKVVRDLFLKDKEPKEKKKE